jgi:hypothetical protein
MQWFKSAMVVSSVMVIAGAFSVEGCSSSPAKTDGGGDTGVTPVDSGKKDTGTTGNDSGGGCPSSAPTCEICDVSSFSPTAQVTPIGPKAGKCPAADTTAFVTACLSANATSSTCQAWQTAEKTSNANCLSCVFTQTTGTGWGPLVCDNNGCKLNVPGCLDLALGQQSQENSTSTGSCGDYLSASYGCQDTACASCTGTDFSTCVNDAVAGACKSYADAFTNSSACSSLNGDTVPANVNNCFPASQTGYTDTEFANFTNFFCGQ